ncbi:hypothetical protein AC579_7025 [Pseudocercospora musae]|uniref:Tat pathway signal sequence n=1 Tax=Pseudocercospora musae TaxID=113226 RepID=A0A139IAU2_9PEZI|nr:hypothetical protein AC579_7025 [Pseudocercospora musae]
MHHTREEHNEEIERSGSINEHDLLLWNVKTDATFHDRRLALSRWLCLALVAVVLLSNVLTAILMQSLNSQDKECPRDECGDIYVEKPSPLHTLDRSWRLETFNAFNYTASRFTQHPSEGDVDAAWESLGLNSGHFLIPTSEAHRFDLERERHVTLPKDLLGEEYFIAMLDVMHQLHCLDALRRALWYNRDWYLKHRNNHAVTGVHIAHTNHCIDSLRERLMCLSDITILPSIWIDRQGKILPDFQRQHKCHDFDNVRAWSYENQMPKTVRNHTFVAEPGVLLTSLPGKDALYRELGLGF